MYLYIDIDIDIDKQHCQPSVLKKKYIFMNNIFPGLESPVRCFFTNLSQSQVKTISFLENVIMYECSPEGKLE